MYKLKEFYNKIPPFFKNKYFVTSIIFLIWINFLNDDPPYELIQNLKEKKNIENKIQLTEKKNNNLKPAYYYCVDMCIHVNDIN